MYHLQLEIHDLSMSYLYEKSVQNFYDNLHNEHRDSGFDLFIADTFDETAFDGFNPIKIDHQVSCAVYKHTKLNNEVTDIQPSGYYMYPRSSISKTPYRLANSVGIIDSGYRGNLIAKVDLVYNKKHMVNRGDRLFQICSPDLSPFASVQIVKKLDSTVRGDGGFGSTGS